MSNIRLFSATLSRRCCTTMAASLALVSLSSVAAPDRVFRSDFEPPISAPAEQWTWVPFDDAFCGDGSTVGIGVNLTAKSERLLIYLGGGGACWDELTCYILQVANDFNGYSEADFISEASSQALLAQPGGFFDRSSAGNPFKDYSYAFVPYCTGDLHAGSNVMQLGVHTAFFVGSRNMAAYLARLARTFPNVDRVVIAGSSAGGFGAVLNWRQTAEAFPGVRVDMIDDSGTVMPEDVLPLPNNVELAQRAAWNLAATLPPGCAQCASSFDGIFSFYAAEYPGSRGALLAYEQDSVLPAFYQITLAKFTQGLTELEAQQFDPTTTLRYFARAAINHVLWFKPQDTTNTTTVQQFVTQMVTEDLNCVSQKESD